MTALVPGARALLAHDRKFYCAMAAVLVVLTAVGFTPTFFARSSFENAGPLPVRVLVHGIAGTAWLLLFATQAALVALRRTEWHRRLGWAAAAIGVAFVVSGVFVIAGLERSHGAEPLAWRSAHLFTNGAPLTAFAVLMAAGVWQRRAAARHKRLLLLAAVVLLPPAIGRLFGRLELTDFNLVAYAALAYANAIYDWLVHRRPHPMSLLGATALVAIDVTTVAWLEAIGS